jgi:hypothetical protein
MRQGESPQLWSGPEDVDETFARARGDLGAVGDVDEVRMTVLAISAIKLISWGYNQRLHRVSGLSEI